LLLFIKVPANLPYSKIFAPFLWIRFCKLFQKVFFFSGTLSKSNIAACNLLDKFKLSGGWGPSGIPGWIADGDKYCLLSFPVITTSFELGSPNFFIL